ncbi:MAG: hypothetical protein GXO63_01715 [Candidatus Micrarchaeota archaeon]|nr:hypothetical protein [Candidatus Micrarchaeota archaeon]
MSYFGLRIYESERDLNELLRRIPREEINNFQNYVRGIFTDYYIGLKKESIKSEKERLETDISLGLKTEEEYLKELEKIEERKNEISGEVKRCIQQNLKLEFHPEYRALLTYSIESITRTGWMLVSDRLIFENGKIVGDRLIYHGKNFKIFKHTPIVKIWNRIIDEYFMLLRKHDN